MSIFTGRADMSVAETLQSLQFHLFQIVNSFGSEDVVVRKTVENSGGIIEVKCSLRAGHRIPLTEAGQSPLKLERDL